MIIPIQREESSTATKSILKSSKSTAQPMQTTRTSATPIATTIIPSVFDRKVEPWKDMSALSIFEPSIKRWRRDDIEDFLLPAITKRSLLSDRFGNLLETFNLDNINMTGLTMKEHPIKIETFNMESDKYVLTLNVKQFKPEELKVNITDSTISVSAKHEDKKDQHNFSCQEFSRSHTLPPGVKADDVKCELSSDGVLTISAPKPVQKSRPSRETNIPIQHIVPAIRV